MDKNNPETPHRRSIRLQGWDYSGEGCYFVTLVTFRRECLFGKIVDGLMNINALGSIVQECWEAIPIHFPNATLDAFAILPNHVHGIVDIRYELDLPTAAEAVPVGAKQRQVPVGARHVSPLQEPASPHQKPWQEPMRPHGVAPGSLGAIIGSFKSSVSRRAGRELNSANLWQRNYYEHIIRNDRELAAIRHYIALNPERWTEDEENPSLL